MAARKLRGIQFDSPDEVEVFHAKESWIPVILGGIPFILLGIAALVVAWWLFKQQTIGLMLLGASVVVAVLSRIPRILANLDTDVVITNKRLYARTGIVDIKDQVCDLSNISDVTVDPSVLGRIFDYANVRVQTFAGDQDFDLRGIAHPYEMRKAINRGSDAVKETRSSRRHETRR